MKDLLLGIDIGTTAAKAALFTTNGQLQSVGSAEYPLHHIRPGWVEQDPENWWKAICVAIRQALADIPHGPERVAGLAVSAQAPTLLALNRAGKPLRRAMIWMDRRAENEVKTMERLLGTDHIFQISGNRPDAFYVASKLLWFKTYEPDLMAQTHQFVQITGYINYRFTGMLSLDHAHAALLQLRDYRTGQWSAELCAMCGVHPEQFPPVLPGHHVLGGMTAEAANETGLLPNTPVMVGTVDGAAAALEAGVVQSGIAAEMTGTSTVLIMPNSTRITEPAFIAMPHTIPDVHLLLGAMVASGASLRWFRDHFGAVEIQASQQLNRDAFDLLTEQAAQIRPGSDGVIFLPYMMGERSPLWHTNARGVLFGLSLSTSRAAVIRAILEGTAFALRHNVEVATRAGIRLTEVRSVGGGTRSALWNQIKADVLGLPILLQEASVGAPFGDALLAGIGLGIYPDILVSARDMVRIKTRYEPDLHTHELYCEFYGVFRSIYEHLRGDFDQAATFVSGKD